MEALKKSMVVLLLLATVLILAVSFPTFFLSTVVQPVALMFWAILRILNSVDQSVYWIVLILACALLVIRLLPADRGGLSHKAYSYTYSSPDRVTYWRGLIRAAALEEEDLENLRDNLRQLFASGLPRDELSPEAQRFLFPPGGSRREASFARRLERALRSFRWLRRWTGESGRETLRMVDQILAKVEMEMEPENER